MSDQENRLYELLNSKKFNELSYEEQIFVLEAVGSEEAYEELRKAILQEKEEAPSDLKASVMDAFDQEHGRSKKALWWKYAAAIAVIAVGTWIFWPAGNPENPQIAEQRQEEPNSETEVSKEEKRIDAEEERSEEPTPSNEGETEAKSVGTQESISERVDDNLTPESEEMAEIAESSEPESAGSSESGFAQSDMAEVSEDKSRISDAPQSESTTPVMEGFVQEESSANQPAAARSMEVNSLSAAASGVNLREIGGPFPNAYVAY